MNGAAVSSGMGTCGLVGQIGVYTGWVNDIAAGTKTAITAFDWAGLFLICFILPAILCPIFTLVLKKLGWIKDGDFILFGREDAGLPEELLKINKKILRFKRRFLRFFCFGNANHIGRKQQPQQNNR